MNQLAESIIGSHDSAESSKWRLAQGELVGTCGDGDGSCRLGPALTACGTRLTATPGVTVTEGYDLVPTFSLTDATGNPRL
jgi:hypothetical protein